MPLGAGLGAGLGAAPAAAAAAVVEGVRFPERMTLAGSELTLNGAGLRERYIKLFAAGLYLPKPAPHPQAVAALEGPKRLRLVMLYEVPAIELAKAIRKQVGRNTSPAEQVALAERLERFGRDAAALGKVKSRDVIDLDFDPASGMALMLNGTLRGDPIAGADFYDALLRTFVGSRPFDPVLKAALLGAAR